MTEILNTITLADGRTLVGVIDYKTKKQLYFFDFTKTNNTDYTILAILWKGNNSNTRFSVFCTINYPDIILPTATIIPINTVTHITGTIVDTAPPKITRKTLKFE